MNFILKICSMLFMVSTVLLTTKVFAEVKAEQELGFMSSYYQYKEPDLMSITALGFSVNYNGKLIFQDSLFIGADLIGFVTGNGHYSSYRTGESNTDNNYYVDLRALFGNSFDFDTYKLDPYIGFGYRYLYNTDLTGYTSTGHWAYDRASNYYYLPIGITHKLSLADKSKLITNLEFDYLLVGEQMSYFSGNKKDADVKNTQKTGFGGRVSVMYQFDNMLFGPYVNYWYINKSDKVRIDKYIVWEPKNNTIEAGLKFSILF